MASCSLRITKAQRENSSRPIRTPRLGFTGSNSTGKFVSAEKWKRPRVKNRKAYFHSRPVGSQLSAWASRQSEVLDGRRVLDARMAEMTERFGDKPIPLPPHWGGYRLKPDKMEFWQGRSNRLHDRFRYTRQADGSWQIDRLAP